MNNIWSGKSDYIWLMIVLIHVVGSTAAGLVLAVPYGAIIVNSLFFLYIAYNNRNTGYGYILCGIGWSIMTYLFFHMPLGYASSLLMNFFIFVYILSLYFGNITFMFKENHFKICKGKELAGILPITVLLLIIGSYVSNLSMLFANNHVQDSLSNVSENVIAGLCVFALAPAFVEEILFRGIFFRKIGGGKKAIFVTALMFALCHMNYNQICYAFIMGIFFALIISLTDNLLVTFLIHFLFNTYSVLLNAFPDFAWIKMVEEWEIFGYHPFNPGFVELSQNDLMQGIMIGGIIAAIAAAFVILILGFINSHPITKDENQISWTPGTAFYLGGIICLGIAFLLK